MENVMLFEEFLNEDLFTKKTTPKGYMYHVGNPFFRKEILKNGLQPTIGDSYSLHHEGKSIKPAIFVKVTKEKATVANDFFPDGMYDSSYNDDIYEINFKDLENNWFEDDDVGDDAFVTFEMIHPKYITLIYKGDGKNN